MAALNFASDGSGWTSAVLHSSQVGQIRSLEPISQFPLNRTLARPSAPASVNRNHLVRAQQTLRDTRFPARVPLEGQWPTQCPRFAQSSKQFV